MYIYVYYVCVCATERPAYVYIVFIYTYIYMYMCVCLYKPPNTTIKHAGKAASQASASFRSTPRSVPTTQYIHTSCQPTYINRAWPTICWRWSFSMSRRRRRAKKRGGRGRRYDFIYICLFVCFGKILYIYICKIIYI